MMQWYSYYRLNDAVDQAKLTYEIIVFKLRNGPAGKDVIREKSIGSGDPSSRDGASDSEDGQTDNESLKSEGRKASVSLPPTSAA
jgi:hypothetical protein